ncbi:MAG: hypothetical protein E7256_00730 [Lachnospiraceae bacterium]|nr:hypothetical protein [Lachnospiraceae bacterium]
MTTVLVILLIAGAILFTLSFFMTEDKVEEVVNVPLSSIEGRSLSGYEEEKIKKHIRTIMEEETAYVLSAAEDRMSRISNEKIIAVNEYSEDLLAKIENNNEEVVFLYNMLKQKEEEMKDTLERVERLKQANAALSKQIQNDTSFEGITPLHEAANRPKQEEERNESIEKQPDIRQKASKKAGKGIANKESGHEKAGEILMLYEQNHSVREIAKQLSLGQSEVKLVIDLYGN